MAVRLRVQHLGFYALLARLPQFALSYMTDFRVVPKPVMMVWEATYRCPGRCLACARWRRSIGANELTTAEAEHMIAEAYALGVRLFVVSGGDPLMRPDVPALALAAKRRGMHTVLCTTGALINEENVQTIMDSFDVFELSLDSLQPELHDRLHGCSGMFESAIGALDLLLKYRQPRHGIELTTVVRDENYQEIGAINRHFSPLGIVTAMQPLHRGLYGAKTDAPSDWAVGCDDAWNRMLDEYRWYDGFSKLALKPFFRQIPAFVRNSERLRGAYTCFAGSYCFFVDPGGYVRICDVPHEAVGHVLENPLRETWAGLGNLRREISSERRTCNCWLLCTTVPSLFLSRCLGSLRHLRGAAPAFGAVAGTLSKHQ